MAGSANPMILSVGGKWIVVLALRGAVSSGDSWPCDQGDVLLQEAPRASADAVIDVDGLIDRATGVLEVRHVR